MLSFHNWTKHSNRRLYFSLLNWPPACSLILCLAGWLAVLVGSIRSFAPGSSIGGPVLGALIECLTLVPGEENQPYFNSTEVEFLTGMGIGRCSTWQSCKGGFQVPWQPDPGLGLKTERQGWKWKREDRTSPSWLPPLQRLTAASESWANWGRVEGCNQGSSRTSPKMV